MSQKNASLKISNDSDEWRKCIRFTYYFLCVDKQVLNETDHAGQREQLEFIFFMGADFKFSIPITLWFIVKVKQFIVLLMHYIIQLINRLTCEIKKWSHFRCRIQKKITTTILCLSQIRSNNYLHDCVTIYMICLINF